MDTAQFMARSMSRILFRSFFLSPTCVFDETKEADGEEAARLWLCDLEHLADLVLLFGFLPPLPRLVLPLGWPSAPSLHWISRELECIRFPEEALDKDALHLMAHTLRRQTPLLLPLSWPGSKDEKRRMKFCASAMDLSQSCNARIYLVKTSGTEELPPESSWIPRHRRISIHSAPMPKDATTVDGLLAQLDAL